ncbi:MAG TPA: cytidylate kinase-like family protein [Opitutaceae bacterium]|nr:cytidylate kinase-like family protein [Opitutaceae bacterium]
MSSHAYLDQGLTILNTRLNAAPPPQKFSQQHRANPFITISRETGAGAATLGRLLLPMLNETLGQEGQGWMFLDKDLLRHLLTTRHLPERLAAYLPEDRVSEIQAVIGELVGLHPPLWELEQQVRRAILQIAETGRVIFAGRAAHLVTHNVPGGLHVRLVASLSSRIHRIMTLLNCSAAAAEAHIMKTDLTRGRYVRTSFDSDIADPHAYDLVINTDRVPPVSAVRMMVQALHDKVASLSKADVG